METDGDKKMNTLNLVKLPIIQLQKTFALLLKSSRSFITPQGFRNTLPDFFKKSFFQQDASEFFKVISDLLENNAKSLCTNPNENIFTKHFESRMRVNIKCEDCNTVTSREEKFIDLYIPIDKPDKEMFVLY